MRYVQNTAREQQIKRRIYQDKLIKAFNRQKDREPVYDLQKRQTLYKTQQQHRGTPVPILDPRNTQRHEIRVQNQSAETTN